MFYKKVVIFLVVVIARSVATKQSHARQEIASSASPPRNDEVFWLLFTGYTPVIHSCGDLYLISKYLRLMECEKVDILA